MKSLTTAINERINSIADENGVTKSELITMVIQVIGEDFESFRHMSPSDRFELILAKIVISFEDKELDSYYTALTNQGPLLDGTKSLDTNLKLVS